MESIKQKGVYIDFEEYGSLATQFYVECFDRYMTIIFKGFDLTKDDLKRIDEELEDAYYKWLDDAECQCCEETMINSINDYYKQYIVAVIYDNEDDEEIGDDLI